MAARSKSALDYIQEALDSLGSLQGPQTSATSHDALITRLSSNMPGDVKEQLKQGFAAGGRPDLAQAVDTQDFYDWVNAESGWQPNITSPANNQGLPNYGLFQLWAGHDWARPDMTPYEQAQAVTQYFPHLTPEKISGYANQIRSGSYPGWG